MTGGEGVSRRFPGRLERELGRRNPPDPSPVSADVQDDRGQLRPQAKLANPLGRVARQGPIRPDERVLGRFLGVAPVAEDTDRDREEAILLVRDEGRKGGVQIGSELPDQGCIRRPREVFHHPMKHQPIGGGCIASSRRPVPAPGRAAPAGWPAPPGAASR